MCIRLTLPTNKIKVIYTQSSYNYNITCFNYTSKHTVDNYIDLEIKNRYVTFIPLLTIDKHCGIKKTWELF